MGELLRGISKHLCKAAIRGKVDQCIIVPEQVEDARFAIPQIHMRRPLPRPWREYSAAYSMSVPEPLCLVPPQETGSTDNLIRSPGLCSRRRTYQGVP